MIDQDASRFSELIHEMRNQLAVARANIEAFIDGKLAPTAERLESILQTLRHLEELIKDMRVLQIDETSPTTHLSNINVCSLLQREYAAMEAMATSKNVSLSVFRCPHPVPACQHFYGDPIRIGQIIKNVLLNAVRYTPQGGSIAVNCSRQADQLEVTISDTGPGVKAADAPRVFEAGFRGKTTSAGEGAGLGLAVVKQLVEAQGGSIALASVSEGGATFTLRLPGRAPTEQADCTAEGCDNCALIN